MKNKSNVIFIQKIVLESPVYINKKSNNVSPPNPKKFSVGGHTPLHTQVPKSGEVKHFFNGSLN
jgi:hypothetical protein